MRYIGLAFMIAVLVVALGGCPPAKGPTFFVVGEFTFSKGDSYLIRLDDPEDIEHARALIRDVDGTDRPLVVCEVTAGTGDFQNRDWFNDGAAWSWHAEFVEFADFTIEILDGNPTMVEDDVDGWIANTGGFIGFWGYTIVEEVSEVDLEL